MSLRIILTGSTGNLGAYLLDGLLALPQVATLVCLNRSTTAATRQHDAHAARGLSVDLPEKRVRFITADFTHSRLGLSDAVYDELAQTTDLLIHNAWPVDFNRNVRSFKPFVQGVNYLAELCLSAANNPVKLLFISSIGATSNWGAAAPSARAFVPEAEITDWKVARTGYGQSKLLSERLLCQAAALAGLPVAIVRVGQLCGPVLHDTCGMWPDREWIPSLIKSSVTLQALPETLGPTETVDWVPADGAAHIIVDVIMQWTHEGLPPNGRRRSKSSQSTAQFFHIVNSHTAEWTDLVPTMRKRMTGDIRTVSFVEWVDMLKGSVEQVGGLEKVNEGRNPAGKLIDFFEYRAIAFPHVRVAQLETVRMAKVSATLRRLEAVSPQWMDLWMRQWGWGECSNSEK